MLTNKELLQFLVAIVDAKLFKTIHVEDFEAIDVKDTDQRSVSLYLVVVIHVDRIIHPQHYPREQSFVYSLKNL